MKDVTIRLVSIDTNKNIKTTEKTLPVGDNMEQDAQEIAIVAEYFNQYATEHKMMYESTRADGTLKDTWKAGNAMHFTVDDIHTEALRDAVQETKDIAYCMLKKTKYDVVLAGFTELFNAVIEYEFVSHHAIGACERKTWDKVREAWLNVAKLHPVMRQNNINERKISLMVGFVVNGMTWSKKGIKERKTTVQEFTRQCMLYMLATKTRFTEVNMIVHRADD